MPSAFAPRRLAIAAALVALLVAVYAAFGYLVAPRLLRDALVERAAAAGFELRLGAIATHAFSLSADAYDVQLSTREHRRLLQARRASVDLSAASLWRRAWVLERVGLEAPVLYGLPSGGKAGEAQLPPLIVSDLSISDGRVELADVPRLHALALEAHDLSTLQGHENRFTASARLGSGGTARSEGTFSMAPFQVAGRLLLAGAPLVEAWRYLPREAGQAPRGTLGGSLRYNYGAGKLALSQASAEAHLASGGSLSARGELALPPFRADLRLRAQALPLSLAQPFLAATRTKLVLAAGALSGEGRLQLGARQRYDGSATLREVRIDGPEGELAGWQSLATDDLHLEFTPFAAHAGEVTATRPRLRVAIGPQGELNLARVAARNGPGAQGKPASIAVARLAIEDGELDFADRSLETPFATQAQSLNGALTQLDTAGGVPARVQLAGRVGRYGEARVQGVVDVTAPSSRTSVQLAFRNLALPDFTPYAAKFAGYRIRSGRLDAQLRYRVRDGRLVGDNKLVFRKLQLGDKVESASALDLPIDLAVALLTDAQGRIDLAIPVRGDLRDPQFDLGGLIAKALRSTLGRIVSAPFRMLASLFGGGERKAPDEVPFAPGSAALSPPAEETMARLAEALAARPQLALSIAGGYDPDADREALARAAVRRELARRAGYGAAAGGSAPSGVDARDPKILHAAERLYLQEGGQAIELSALEPRKPGYGRRLLAALAGKTNVAGEDLQALARERAQSVRDALTGRGLDGQRLRVEAPKEVQAEEQGVPVKLDVRALRRP